jgi:radical SAM protein with 4Fe4S-binding SPASM domain
VTTRPSLLSLTESARARRLGSQSWGSLDGRVLAPLRVEIQPTAHCHRICVFCSHILRNKRGGELSPETILRLLEELRELGVERIAFSGGGEPLFWQAGDIKVVLEAAAQFAAVSLTTSGDQFWDDREGVIAPEAEAAMKYCRLIYLNIPAADESNFKRQISAPASWHHTRRVISELVALSRQSSPANRCEIHGVVVISALNVDQVARVDAALIELGVDRIYYKRMNNFEGRNLAKLKLEDEIILSSLARIRPEERSPDLLRFIAGLRRGHPAPVPCWTNRLALDAVVDPHGDIFLCTPTVGSAEHCIGNLDSGSFSSCWANASRAAILQSLSSRSLAGLCPAECRYHADNQRLDHLVQDRESTDNAVAG